MEHNIDVMEGTRFPLCVTLKDGEGNALAGDGFRVYGGAVCPGMGAVSFPVTRSGGEFVVMVPGLAVGRMPWRYQVFVVEQATGVEWLLVSGEVRPEARCADASGGVAAGSLTVTGVLDKQTLSLGVQLGESTELCRSLVARAEEAARRAEEAAEGMTFELTAAEVKKVVPIGFDERWEKPIMNANDGSVAFGSGTNTYGGGCVAIGKNAKVTSDGGVSIGKGSRASNGVTIGESCSGYTGNVIIGISCSSIYEGNIIVGRASYVSGYYEGCIVMGWHSGASSSYAMALGSYANAEGYGGVAIGLNSITEGGSYNIAIGEGARSKGTSSVAMGHGASANSESVAIGKNSTLTSDFCMGIGAGTRVLHPYSAAVGVDAKAEAVSSFALGQRAKATQEGELLLSAYNRAKGTRLSLELIPGAATGFAGDMANSMPFMNGAVRLTGRDELSGLQHSIKIPLNTLVMHLKTIAEVEQEFGVVEEYGYGYGY